MQLFVKLQGFILQMVQHLSSRVLPGAQMEMGILKMLQRLLQNITLEHQIFLQEMFCSV